MKKVLVGSLLLVVALMSSSAQADADERRCSSEGATWQSEAVLKEKLTDEGWDVRQIKSEDGCYEVYAITDKGERVEAHFDPATLMLVRTKRED